MINLGLKKYTRKTNFFFLILRITNLYIKCILNIKKKISFRIARFDP
jgi:hypothetical protein